MSFIDSLNRRAKAPQEDHWIPLSDLMTGMMMVFLLIAVAFMVIAEHNVVETTKQASKIQQIAVVYDQMRAELYADLMKEFKSDLPKWGAEIDQDLTVRFNEPSVLFDLGKSDLKPSFKAILDDFFPRYTRILRSDKYRDGIDEIRIEGHTSSVWSGAAANDSAYFLNMELSQSRTRSTLEYLLLRPSLDADQKKWLIAHLTANGLSSSHLIRNADGTENPVKSQRVEFRVRTNADAKIREILEATK